MTVWSDHTRTERDKQAMFGSLRADDWSQSEAPNYYNIIKKPMDLKIIKQSIRDGTISTIDEFERDLLLMFSYVSLVRHYGFD
jgi:bromodomain-containing protein 8